MVISTESLIEKVRRSKDGSFLVSRTPMQRRFTAAKCNAFSRGIPFLLSFDEFSVLASRECFYCGGLFGKVKNAGGLDRIDNSLGYEPSNVLPCCGVCNTTRGNRWTVEEMRVMILAVIQLRGANYAERT